MITYIDSTEGIRAEQLRGFFVDWGWKDPPPPEKHLELLKRSDHVVLAIDEESSRAVGFITAISDGVLSSYIPLLEVLRPYQGRGIGKELVRRMLEKLQGLYMIDLCCDPGLERFYSQFGMMRVSGMVLRNYERQSGA
jgi:ribosomal protein S18 acetylase RimI-like enzyme